MRRPARGRRHAAAVHRARAGDSDRPIVINSKPDAPTAAMKQTMGHVRAVLRSPRRRSVALLLSSRALLAADCSGAPERLPIIDVHLHGGFKAGAFVVTEDGTPLARPCRPVPCDRPPARLSHAADIIPRTLEAMRAHNIVLGVVSDAPPMTTEARSVGVRGERELPVRRGDCWAAASSRQYFDMATLMSQLGLAN